MLKSLQASEAHEWESGLACGEGRAGAEGVDLCSHLGDLGRGGEQEQAPGIKGKG